MITKFPVLPSFRAMDRLAKLIDELTPEPLEPRWGWYPSVDVKETDKELCFVMDLPGINEKDLEVEVTGDVLTIKGRRDFARDEKKEDYVRIERGYGAFERSFSLNFPVKPEQVDAKYENGVLRVTIPKAEGVQAHRVPVQVNGKS